jgi:MoaA/NifB/PqqE/SkfB family radical SAM enzyme
LTLPTSILVGREALRARYRPKFSHLILHVTNVCNFRCNHCFIEFQKKPKDLSYSEIQTIATSVNDLIWLDIGGGEPFLRSDLSEILCLFRAQEISIPTNGWFTQKIITTLEKIESQGRLPSLIITISIDGLPDTHDRIRKKSGSFDRLLSTFEQIRQRFPSLRIKINSVLCEDNYNEFIDLMDFVYEEFRPTYHGVQFLRGDPINLDYRLPSVQQIADIEETLKEKQSRYTYGRKGLNARITRNYQSLKREISRDILATKKQVIHCYGGQAHLVIYPDGRVATCEMLPPVANLRTEPLEEILKSEKWKNAVGDIVDRMCHCTHDCNMMENILFNFKLYPKLLLGSKAADASST